MLNKENPEPKTRFGSFWYGAGKTKILAVLIASFAVFFATYFVMAENKNTGTIFLDSDQDGLTDQEERMIGTDPMNADTDKDGYTDGKEVQSGYNPLKPAPGDALLPASTGGGPDSPTNTSSRVNDSSSATDFLSQQSLTDALYGDSSSDDSLNSQSYPADASSDPDNLTGQMINNFLQLTLDKSQTDESFTDNPSYSEDELNQIIQSSLASTDITQNLPEISDSDIKILPEINDKDLADDEVKDEQKQQVEKYLASLAFVFASNSPFPVDDTGKFQTNVTTETDSLLSALAAGDQTKLDDYAERSRDALDQAKEVEVPYILKDFHKSILQLATYTLGFRDSVATAGSDPMKSLASISSLQAVGDQALKLQGELTNILGEYGIDFVEIKQ